MKSCEKLRLQPRFERPSAANHLQCEKRPGGQPQKKEAKSVTLRDGTGVDTNLEKAHRRAPQVCGGRVDNPVTAPVDNLARLPPHHDTSSPVNRPFHRAVHSIFTELPTAAGDFRCHRPSCSKARAHSDAEPVDLAWFLRSQLSRDPLAFIAHGFCDRTTHSTNTTPGLATGCAYAITSGAIFHSQFFIFHGQFFTITAAGFSKDVLSCGNSVKPGSRHSTQH